MTKSLTEQMYNGTLEEGYYYVLVKDIEGIVIDEYCLWYKAKEGKARNNFSYGTSIKEVLSPVPTYEEYIKLKRDLDEYALTYKIGQDVNNLTQEENKKLKEQLKEANMVIKRELRRQSPKGGVLLGDMNDYLEKWGVK